MRTIGLSAVIVLALLSGAALTAAAPEADTPFTQIARLASFLSDNEPVGALEAFDKSMPRFGAISEEIQGLIAQTEILCAIDVVEDKESAEPDAQLHHLDLDWYMTLKSRGDESRIESRRQRVSVTMQRFQATKNGKTTVSWRITSLAPEKILAPMNLK